MPMDSRKIIAGSSSSKLFTISILADDSQRGISCLRTFGQMNFVRTSLGRV